MTSRLGFVIAIDALITSSYWNSNKFFISFIILVVNYIK